MRKSAYKRRILRQRLTDPRPVGLNSKKSGRQLRRDVIDSLAMNDYSFILTLFSSFVTSKVDSFSIQHYNFG